MGSNGKWEFTQDLTIYNKNVNNNLILIQIQVKTDVVQTDRQPIFMKDTDEIKKGKNSCLFRHFFAE